MHPANQLLKESLSVRRVVVCHNLDELGISLRYPNVFWLHVVNLDSKNLISFFHWVVPRQDWDQDLLHELSGLKNQLCVLCGIVHAWSCLNYVFLSLLVYRNCTVLYSHFAVGVVKTLDWHSDMSIACKVLDYTFFLKADNRRTVIIDNRNRGPGVSP
jgi:hypothetical protein